MGEYKKTAIRNMPAGTSSSGSDVALDAAGAARPARSGMEIVREALLTAMHCGKLRPGDRVPSVRRMAAMTGLNRKTVHRNYQKLANEGMLDVRWGSGTYLAEDSAHRTSPSVRRLLGTVSRLREEADDLGLSPSDLARFLTVVTGDGLAGLPVAVVECNLEQVSLIGLELHRDLHLRIQPVTLAALQRGAAQALSGVRAVVTTDCHREEVAPLVEPLGIPLLRIALTQEFPRTMVRHARRGPVVMVVRDARFGPIFKRLLEQMAFPAEAIARIAVIEPRQVLTTFRDLTRGAVYVSPTVEREVDGAVPHHLHRIPAESYLARDSVERLRAQLAFAQVAPSGESASSGSHAPLDPVG